MGSSLFERQYLPGGSGAIASTESVVMTAAGPYTVRSASRASFATALHRSFLGHEAKMVRRGACLEDLVLDQPRNRAQGAIDGALRHRPTFRRQREVDGASLHRRQSQPFTAAAGTRSLSVQPHDIADVEAHQGAPGVAKGGDEDTSHIRPAMLRGKRQKVHVAGSGHLVQTPGFALHEHVTCFGCAI